jgi:hypothetical protein
MDPTTRPELLQIAQVVRYSSHSSTGYKGNYLSYYAHIIWNQYRIVHIYNMNRSMINI